MITPKDYQLESFFSEEEQRTQEYLSLQMEDLKGADLIDNLILLRFAALADIQSVMHDRYGINFVWLNMDPTPADMRNIADKYGVMIQRAQNQVYVFIKIGATFDDAAFQVDVPDYKVSYFYIADCNYNIIKTGMAIDVLSFKLAQFRPLLVFRRIVLDCIRAGGTDIHFKSMFVNKVPAHGIYYRIKKEMIHAEFRLDFEMMQKIIQTAVNKLSPVSAADLDSFYGVQTSISDLFGDGTTDLRLTGSKAAAGLNVVIRIQTLQTTTLRVDELGFPERDVDLIRRIAQCRTGLTLVTGKINSGKNTTIYAMLNELIDEPINIVEFSNPIENRMPITQIDYRGDIDILKSYMRMAKKMDIDISVLNEIPNDDVAFAVRDLVNSAVGVITTTHIDRIWHLPLKLQEFFGKDYKTIISQLNACINQRMFRRWTCPKFVKRSLVKSANSTDFEKFAINCGVTQYFVPEDPKTVTYQYQPLAEILVITDEMKTAMLNFDQLSQAEQMLRMHIEKQHGKIENKLAEYINSGACSLKELESMQGPQ